MTEPKSKYFECCCHAYDHPLKLTYFAPDDEDLYGSIYICVQIRTYNSFWKRLYEGFRYIFGIEKKINYMEFEIDERETIDEMIGFLDMFEEEI